MWFALPKSLCMVFINRSMSSWSRCRKRLQVKYPILAEAGIPIYACHQTTSAKMTYIMGSSKPSSWRTGSSRVSASQHVCKRRTHHDPASLHTLLGSCTPQVGRRCVKAPCMSVNKTVKQGLLQRCICSNQSKSGQRMSSQQQITSRMY